MSVPSSGGVVRSRRSSATRRWWPRACGTAGGVVALARDHGVELPIAEMVSAVIEGRSAPGDFLAQFMARAAKAELDGIR